MTVTDTTAIPDLATADLSTSLDPSNLDRRLQRITNTTGMWGLPSLPDNVKLDLATSDQFSDDEDLDGFLTGLQADIDEQTRRTAVNQSYDTSRYTTARPGYPLGVQAEAGTPDNALFLPEDDFRTQLRRLAAGVDLAPGLPTIIVPDSVQRFKSRAIGRGILSPDTPIDGTWSPQMNQARYEMMQDDFASRLAGNRPGAVSSKNVMDMIGEWATPQGLLSTAVAMDFLPDVSAIKRETSQWGDKFRKWWKNKTSVTDFIDAMTGPIDDIALPVVNTALLFSGVGNVVTFGRGVMLADDVARGATWASRLATNPIARRVPTFGRLVDVSAEAEKLRSAGIMAQRLQKSSRAGLSAAGDALAAWRRQTGVIMTKKAVQQGMRIGFAGQVENLLLPSNSGVGLGGAGTLEERKTALGFDEWVGRRLENPLVAGLSTWAELAFTPTSIFDEGTFTRPLTSGYQKIKRSLWELPADRAAGAAVVSAGLEKLRQVDPTRHAELQEILRAGRRPGASRVLDPQQRIAAELFAGGDVEKAGEIMSYIVYTAGLDSMARRETVRILQDMALDEGSTTFKRTYHVARDKFINQLRPLDDVDLTTEHGRNLYRAYKSNIAALDEAGGDVRSLRKRHWEDLAVLHDDTQNADLLTAAAEEIAQHGDVRTATLKDLLDNIAEEDIVRVIDEAWDTWGNWDNYVTALRRVQELDFEGGGFSLRTLKDLKRNGWTPSTLGEEIGGKLLPTTKIRKSWIDNLQSGVQEGRGRITLARIDTPTAQQAELLRQQVKVLETQLKNVRGLEEAHAGQVLQSLEEFAAAKGKTIAKLTDKDLGAWRSQAIRTPTTPPGTGLMFSEGVNSSAAARYADAVRYATRNNATPQEAAQFLEGKLAGIDNAAEMWAQFGVQSNVGDLSAKLKELTKRAEFIAQDVDVPKDVADELAAMGYKVVHGSEFGRPDDILDLNSPLSALSVNDLRKRSFGTFVGRDQNTMERFEELREQRFRNIFGAELRKLNAAGIDTGSWGRTFQIGDATPDMDGLLEALRKGRLTMLENAEFAARDDEALGWISSMGARVRNTGLPHSLYRMRKKQLQAILGEGFSDKGYDALISALRKAENIGFEYQGLQSIENHLVANSWARGGLKLLSGTEAADGLAVRERIKRGKDFFRNGQHVAALRDWKNAARQSVLGGKSAFSPTLAARGVGAVAGAGIAAGIAVDAGGDPFQAALVGAVGGAASPRLINPRMMARLALAGGAATVTGEFTGSNAAAGLAGITAAVASPTAARAALKHLDRRGLAQYSKLGDNARYYRDRLRFSLSPFFDIQRYTEGLVLSTVADVPDGVSLPVTTRPMKRFLADAKDRYAEAGMTRDAIIQEFKQSARGWIDLDQVDTAQAWMYERGIMGFSPTEWMAAAYGQLTRQGMAKEAAVDAVRNTYTYGTKGRSGLEMSANFVFFPFSFQKKYLTDIGKFLSKDLTRTVLLHDSMKMWDTLYEEYDLEEMWKDHLPALRNMRKINALAFGISPGELGGINRPFYEIGRRIPVSAQIHDAILNAFLPHAFEIKSKSDWDELRPQVQRMLPVWRDAEDLMEDLKQQGHVLFAPSHVTEAKEADLGWSEHRRLTADVHKVAEEMGTSYSAIMNPNNEEYSQLREYVLRQRNEIERKYPAFVADRKRSIDRAISKAETIRDITTEPQNEAEAAMARFQLETVDLLENYMASRGLSLPNGIEGLREKDFNFVRQRAIEMARQVPEFASLYRRYYAGTWGPLEVDLP
jgi:hypothetical protein